MYHTMFPMCPPIGPTAYMGCEKAGAQTMYLTQVCPPQPTHMIGCTGYMGCHQPIGQTAYPGCEQAGAQTMYLTQVCPQTQPHPQVGPTGWYGCTTPPVTTLMGCTAYPGCHQPIGQTAYPGCEQKGGAQAQIPTVPVFQCATSNVCPTVHCTGLWPAC